MKKRPMFVGVTAIVLSFILAFAAPSAALAATSPSLGAAASYAILASTYSNTFAGTTVNGDVGFTAVGAPAVDPQGVHPNYGEGAPYSTAGTDQDNALSVGLAPQVCTYSFPIGDIDLSTDISRIGATVSVYEPGVYCIDGAMDVSGPLTLDGSGTYIFRSTGALTSGDNSIVVYTGVSACDVFWTAGAATTLGADTIFVGTVIDDSGITVGANTVWEGRALAFGGTVTTGDTSTITAPSCGGTIAVNKIVVNDDGGSMVSTDFPLFVDGNAVVPGFATAFSAGAHVVTETSNSGYTQSFSGSCPGGVVNLSAGEIAACTITNDDIEQSSGGGGGGSIIPPLIDVVKVPSPLALPGGPGPVTYTYTVRNIGPVAMTDITLVGDTCAPITLISGDTNTNAVLEVTETWTYTCSTTLAETHTNTVTATGWANGMNSIDIAVATVVVGGPVPPLIHVTKVPSPLFLPVAGGLVTYTERITNPGTVPLANVTLVDDRCSPMMFVGGDSDGDGLLDTSETWTYTCATNLSRTTTNTAVATGEANGITVTDFAIATVVVGVPGLPSTGIPPDGSGTSWSLVFVGMLMIVSLSLVSSLRKQTD